MLTRVQLTNFGPLHNIDWRDLGKINLIIGGNGSGKTFFLKAVYSAMRTLEAYKRGREPRSAAEILADKLYWTFQAEKIGDLVTKGADSALSLKITLDNHDFLYSYGKDTTRHIASIENHVPARASNSIFLPAKEVLSIHHIILKSREQDTTFGFDDTYLDLARALRQPTTKGKNIAEFVNSRKTLEDMLGGKVEYDEASGQWKFRKGNQRFTISVTAEGIKKIAILDTLIGNRYLSPESIVFIDEPESALHPSAISQLLDIIEQLSKRGIQFFLATHSYFVIKKLLLIAQKQDISIPVLSAIDQNWQYDDLQRGMPDNPIIDESIRLYREEVDLVLQ